MSKATGFRPCEKLTDSIKTERLVRTSPALSRTISTALFTLKLVRQLYHSSFLLQLEDRDAVQLVEQQAIEQFSSKRMNTGHSHFTVSVDFTVFLETHHTSLNAS